MDSAMNKHQRLPGATGGLPTSAITPIADHGRLLARRWFMRDCGIGLGTMAAARNFLATIRPARRPRPPNQLIRLRRGLRITRPRPNA